MTGKPNDWIPGASAEPILLQLEEPHYWHLYPTFLRLHSQTGRLIDLYESATFAGPDLVALLETIAEARTQVETHPPSWDVHVGTRTHPDRRELYETIQRDEILTALDIWREIARRAPRQGRAVFCRGD